jgi:uncharacterized protein (TIGR02996 family)
VSDQRALLAAICAHPEEDTPRLAYADWLDEHAASLPKLKQKSASMRAELIRVQCELARLPPDEEDADTAIRRAELENRQDVLLSNTAHRREWAQPLIRPEESGVGLLPDEGAFIRGFPHHAGGLTRAILVAGARLLDISPLHQLVCQDYHASLTDELLGQPWLARVRRLVVTTDGLRLPDGTEYAPTEQLFTAPALAGLESLGLNLWAFHAPGTPVARPALVNLRRLDLRGEPPRGRASFARLGELLPPTVRFREFSISGYPYGPADLTTLAKLPQFGELERLTLGGSVNEHRFTRPLDAATLRAVADAPFWKTLRALVGERTGRSNFLRAAVGALPTTPANLRTLALTPDSADGIAALFDNPLLQTVTALNLSGTVLGNGTRLLASSPHLRQLLSLKLASCPLGDFGVKALAGAKFAGQLVRLNLEQCQLGTHGIETLIAPRNFPALRRLELGRTRATRAQQDRLRTRYGDGLRL